MNLLLIFFLLKMDILQLYKLKILNYELEFWNMDNKFRNK